MSLGGYTTLGGVATSVKTNWQPYIHTQTVLYCLFSPDTFTGERLSPVACQYRGKKVTPEPPESPSLYSQFLELRPHPKATDMVSHLFLLHS